jgi:SAM-dependent methyltransferase
MSAGAELFDRGLLRRRRSRFAGEVSQHEFLLARVATEIAERIEAILREFPLALDLGAFNGVLGRRVGALPSVGEMIYAESAPALAKLCPRPVVVCDEDLLPFRDGSLSLVVSGLALHRVNDLPGALIQIRRALHPDGLFLGAALGGRSLQELRQSLLEAEAEEEGGASPRIAPFADVRDYGALLQRGLRASRDRRRPPDPDLSLPARPDAGDQGARRRQRHGGAAEGAVAAADASTRRSDLPRPIRHR